MQSLEQHNASVLANRSDDPPEEDWYEESEPMSPEAIALQQAEEAEQISALIAELAYEKRLVEEALGDGGWLEWEAR
jgi:hypothetical protein